MKEEKKYMAECDFRSLSEAEVIKGDKGRHSAALKAGNEMVKKKDQEVSMMKKVAKMKPRAKKRRK